MVRTIYNPKEKTGYGSISLKKGPLSYSEETKTYFCEVSDISRMGIINIPPIFEILNIEKNDIQVFTLSLIKRNEESDIEYWLFKSPDGFTFQINDP